MRYLTERHLADRKIAGVFQVTAAEFIAAAIAAGWTEKQAKLQAKWSLALGSEVKVGNRVLQVVNHEGSEP